MEDDFLWHFTGIYGHPEAAMKIHTWELLHRLHSFSSLPWINGGDFNEIWKPLKNLDELPKNLDMSNFSVFFAGL